VKASAPGLQGESGSFAESSATVETGSEELMFLRAKVLQIASDTIACEASLYLPGLQPEQQLSWN